MKKTLKIFWLVCLVLLACTLVLTGCDEEEKPNDTNDDVIDDGGEHVHAFGDWTVTKEATCTVDGTKERVCSCGEKEVLGIESLGHIKVVDPATAPTCIVEGKTEGEHCSTCGLVFVEQSSIPVVDHTYDNEEDEKCNVCDFIRDVDCKHTKTETLKAVSATCTKDGLTEGKKCAKCGEILVAQKTVNKLGHKEVIDSAVAPTCAKEGKTEGSHCSRCNKTIVAQKKIDKLPHTEVIDEAVAPTCTKTGLTEGKHCSVCDTVIEKQSTVAATGHKSGEWIVSKESTCTSDGEKIQQCVLCETILSTSVIAGKHSHIITQSLPTCLSKGSTTLTCTKCSYSHTEEWLPITFEIERGNYYLNQGQTVIYYLELIVKNVSGGRVEYDEGGNRIKNTYTVVIYNTLTQEIGEFQITDGQTDFASKRFYGGTDIFGSSVFQITINDGYSSYIYFLDRHEAVAELIDIPTQHHDWSSTACGQKATCSLCNIETIIEHESVNNVCVNCFQTTYMPKVTYSTDMPLHIRGGEIESVSFAFSPYTSSDMHINLNITVLGWKTSTDSLIGFNIKIYDSNSGMLISERNELMGSEVAAGYFSREISCLLIKSGNYRVVISSYF